MYFLLEGSQSLIACNFINLRKHAIFVCFLVLSSKVIYENSYICILTKNEQYRILQRLLFRIEDILQKRYKLIPLVIHQFKTTKEDRTIQRKQTVQNNTPSLHSW